MTKEPSSENMTEKCEFDNCRNVSFTFFKSKRICIDHYNSLNFRSIEPQPTEWTIWVCTECGQQSKEDLSGIHIHAWSVNIKECENKMILVREVQEQELEYKELKMDGSFTTTTGDQGVFIDLGEPIESEKELMEEAIEMAAVKTFITKPDVLDELEKWLYQELNKTTKYESGYRYALQDVIDKFDELKKGNL